MASAELLLWRAPEAASTCLCDLDAPRSPEPFFFYEKREKSKTESFEVHTHRVDKPGLRPPQLKQFSDSQKLPKNVGPHHEVFRLQ